MTPYQSRNADLINQDDMREMYGAGSPDVPSQQNIPLGKQQPITNEQKPANSSSLNPFMIDMSKYPDKTGQSGSLMSGLGTPHEFMQALSNPKDISTILETVAGMAMPYGRIAKGIGEAYEYLNPAKSAGNFMKSLGGGTGEENIASLASDIKNAHDTNVADALPHRQNILDQTKDVKDIYKVPESALPEGNLYTIARVFSDEPENLSLQNMNDLKNAIKSYRKNNDFDGFMDKASNIFKSGDIPTKQTNALEDMLSIPTRNQSSYLNVSKNNDGFSDYLSKNSDLKQLHDEFVQNPNVKNSVDLNSQLGSEIGAFQKQSKIGNLDVSGRNQLSSLVRARDALGDDQNSFFQRFNPALKDQNDTFKQKWVENVVPYHADQEIKDIVKNKGIPGQGTTPGNLESIFKFPDQNAQKIMQDIGQPGQNKILYNAMHKIPQNDSDAVAQALQNAKQSGYQGVVTPEMEELAKSLQTRGRARTMAERVGAGTMGAVGGGILGNPILGAGIGLAALGSKSALGKAIELFAKKK